MISFSASRNSSNSDIAFAWSVASRWMDALLEKSFNVKAIDSYLGMNSTELRQIVRHRGGGEAGR